MELVNLFPWWVVEIIVLIFFARTQYLMLHRRSKVIEFTFSPSLSRSIVWSVIILLLLHEVIGGWKFPLGLQLTMYQEAMSFFLGLLAFLSGLALNKWSFATMRHYMTPPESIPDASQAQLITAGPYATFRHPTYLSYLLMFTGAQLYAYSPLVLLAIPLWLAFRRWAVNEEEIMITLFSDTYLRYRSRTWRGI